MRHLHPGMSGLSYHPRLQRCVQVALSMVLRGELRPDDHIQVSTNVRATAVMQADVELCRLVGAACTVVGLVAPKEGLDAVRP